MLEAIKKPAFNAFRVKFLGKDVQREFRTNGGSLVVIFYMTAMGGVAKLRDSGLT